MKKIIVGNWKCNPTSLNRAQKLFNLAKRGIKKIKNIEVVICSPFIYLPAFQQLENQTIKLGAQNCFWEERGAFTGEISPLMLKDLRCKYVITGHSERRALGETDGMINKKLKAILKEKLTPILCIGENERERKKGETFKILKNQLKKDMKDIEHVLKFIVAYEPIWAIGTGNPCLPEIAKKVLVFLKKILWKTPVLYGGSVNSQIAKDYIDAGFDGLLVGGASLKTKEFIKIVKQSTNID